jgi:hypothetical protein
MKRFIIIILVLILVWIGCKDAQPLVGTTPISELKYDTLYAQIDTFLVKGRISTAGSPKLLLGSYAGFNTQSLLHFLSLPDDTILVDSLYLRLHSWSNYGSDEALLTQITGKIHLIEDQWEESINETGEILTRSIESDPFFISEDSLSYQINLPLSLLDAWRDTTGGNNNFGLMLDFDSGSFIKEFYSGNTVYPPELIWTYRHSNSDSIIRDTTSATLDASLIDFSRDVDPGALYITSGYVIHSFIKFDFTMLPKNINISYVNFDFSGNPEYANINNNRSNNFYLKNVQTPFEILDYEGDIIIDEAVPEDLFILTDHDNASLERHEEQLKKSDTGRYYIQDILNGSVDHDSFLLMYTNQGNDASIYALKRSQNKNEAPRIIIGYNTLIAPRL